MNILVIDVGTSGMRGALYAPDGRELAVKHGTYQPVYRENGWVEQDPAQWEDALYATVKGVVEKAGRDISALALTSQRSSVIPVDREIRPLGNAIMWQDKRTEEICARLAGENDRIFQKCGARVNPVFSAAKMTWIRENLPDVYAKTEKFLVVPDFLLHRITGELTTDHTYGSRSLLMDLRARAWDDDLLKTFRVERDKLCQLVPAGSVCGKVTEHFAKLTGCPAGIPVVTCGGDQQCGAVGQGVVRPGVLSVTAGTGGFLIGAVENVPEGLEQDVICNASAIDGQYILESSVLTCCSAFDWFKREFYPGSDYAAVDADIAGTPAGANGVVCLPHFQGRAAPDWNSAAKGVFANVTLGTTRADMARSLLEGICWELAEGIDILEKYAAFTEVCVNGGLTNSPPFNDIQCSVYGRRIVRRGKADATARGALSVAAKALGMYSSVEAAYEALCRDGKEQEFLPEPEKVRRYRELRAELDRLYGKLWN